MKKTRKIILLLLCLALAVCSVVTAIPVGASDNDGSAILRNAAPVSVTLDGKRVLAGDAMLINSVTYVPVRAFSELLGADSVSWSQRDRTATVKKGTLEIYISENALYVGANGRYFFTVERILNINGRLYVPVRAIAEAFSVTVGWDGVTRTVILKTTGKQIKSGDSFYNSTDLYWLSRIINAEAGGEPLLGMIAVGNVVLNRRDSSMYPNTVYGVVFDKKGGTQFSPVAMGTIYRTPSQASIIAAKICLEGYSVDDDILFFMNPSISTSNWISKNRPFAFVIGKHYFYY